MKFHSAHIDNLRMLSIDQIQHLLSAENQMVDALPKMLVAATDPELKRMLQDHLQETREQVSRLEHITQKSNGRLLRPRNEATHPARGVRFRVLPN